MKNPSTKTLKSKTQIPCSQSPSMESFTLLNFLRRDDNGDDDVVSSRTTSFVSEEETQRIKEVKSEESGGDVSDDDEGPFFDLEFAVPEDEDVDNGDEKHDEESDFGDEDDEDLNFIDRNLSLSPSDELFFKGSFIQLDSSSPDLVNSSSPNSKSHKFPVVSFLKSATKFRVFMLSFKKPKFSSTEKKSDEIASPDEKKNLGKYLSKIKQGSKRYGEKMKFSGNLGKISSSPTSVIPSFSSSPSKKSFRADIGNLGKLSSPPTTGFRVVCKHLGKSRSASSTSSSSSMAAVVQSRRQDDSLLQQEDGIQSAILHCKRSFNSSDSASLLFRSTSDPTHEKNSSIDLQRKTQTQSIAEERRGN